MHPVVNRVGQGATLIIVVVGVLLAISVLGSWSRGMAVAQVPCPRTPPPSPSPTPSPPKPIGEICYPPGWNLVAGPMAFPVPLLIWNLSTGQYSQLPARSELPGGPIEETNGQGAWAFFAQTTAMGFSISVPSSTPVSVSMVAGEWYQIGDPFNYSDATVCGAGASVFAFTYDPVAGTYSQATTLRFGEGAWVYSPAGDTVTLAVVNPPPGFGCPSS